MKDLILDEAFILHRRPWREKSLLLEVFSNNHGRVKVIARGQRTVKKKHSNFEPFQKLRLQLRGNSELKTLITVESLNSPIKLIAEQLYCGFYLNELLSKLLPLQDEAEELFFQYVQALEDLSVNQISREKVLRLFERSLFAYSGLSFDSQYSFDGELIKPDASYHWFENKGWSLARQDNGEIYSGVFVQKLALSEIDEDDLALYKVLHRRMVDSLLGGRELYSRQLFQRIK